MAKRAVVCMMFFVIFMTTFAVHADESKLTAGQWFEKGKTYKENKDFSNAIAAFSEAIKLDPQLGQAFIERGILYLTTKQNDLAVTDLSKAIELAPKKADLYWLRGLAYAGKGQHLKAIEEYNNTLRLDDKMYLAYWTSALSYEKTGPLFQALEYYREFVKRAPPDYPNIDKAKDRIKQLENQDNARIEASDNVTKKLSDSPTTKMIFDFLKTDYLTVDLIQPGWEIGFQKTTNNQLMIELVKGPETVNNWTQLITVQFFSGMKNVSPRQLAEFIVKHQRDTYGDRAKVDIVRATDSEALVEYRVAGQPGTKDEHTITRIIKGKASMIYVHYAARPVMGADNRAMGLAIIEGAKYSDQLPENSTSPNI